MLVARLHNKTRRLFPNKRIRTLSVALTKATVLCAISCASICVFPFPSISRPYRSTIFTMPADKVVAQYFETPFSSMKIVDSTMKSDVEKPEEGYFGYLMFECNSVPILKNSAKYKPAGDVVALIDSCLAVFKQGAWPLLNTKDVECVRMRDSDGTKNWFLYNRKTNRYFFRHGDNAKSIDGGWL